MVRVLVYDNFFLTVWIVVYDPPPLPLQFLVNGLVSGVSVGDIADMRQIPLDLQILTNLPSIDTDIYKTISFQTDHLFQYQAEEQPFKV